MQKIIFVVLLALLVHINANNIEIRGSWEGPNHGSVVMMRRATDNTETDKRGTWNGNSVGGVVNVNRRSTDDTETEKRATWMGNSVGGAVTVNHGTWIGNNMAGGKVLNGLQVKPNNLTIIRKPTVVPVPNLPIKKINATDPSVDPPKPTDKRDIFDDMDGTMCVGLNCVVWRRSLNKQVKRGTWIGNNLAGGQVINVLPINPVAVIAPPEIAVIAPVPTVAPVQNVPSKEINATEPTVNSPKSKRGSWIGPNHGKVVMMRRSDEDKEIEIRGTWNGKSINGTITHREKHGSWEGPNQGKVTLMRRSDEDKEKRGTWIGNNMPGGRVINNNPSSFKAYQPAYIRQPTVLTLKPAVLTPEPAVLTRRPTVVPVRKIIAPKSYVKSPQKTFDSPKTTATCYFIKDNHNGNVKISPSRCDIFKL